MINVRWQNIWPDRTKDNSRIFTEAFLDVDSELNISLSQQHNNASSELKVT